MDERSSAFFQRLRQGHFPRDRNFIPAHLTLFHKLPGDAEESIIRALGNLARIQPQALLEAAHPSRVQLSKSKYLAEQAGEQACGNASGRQTGVDIAQSCYSS